MGEGLSAINMYMGMRHGWNQPEDYVEYVRNDMMGISREDLVYDVGPSRGQQRPYVLRSGDCPSGTTTKGSTSAKAAGR